MREFYHDHKNRIDRILFIVLVSVSFYLFFTVFFVYLAPFFFGLIIAVIMEPVNRFLERRLKMKRWIASLICLLLFIAVISSLGVWLVNILVRQGESFVYNAPSHIEEISERLDDANIWLQRFSENLPEGWYLPDIQEMVPAMLNMFFGDGMREAGMRTLVGVPDYVINVIIGLVSAYFFMADSKRIYQFVKDATPRWIRKQMRQTKRGLKRAMGGYFRAQGILMVMVFIVSVIGLLILGNDYALIVGLILAVLDFLPILGPALVLIPWALLSIFLGNMHHAIGLLIIWGIITITRQVLQPKILGSQMGAHPLASLMSIYIGFRIFGLLGFIIGPTLLIVLIAIKDAEGEDECMIQRNEKSA